MPSARHVAAALLLATTVSVLAASPAMANPDPLGTLVGGLLGEGGGGGQQLLGDGGGVRFTTPLGVNLNAGAGLTPP
ncbi:hypothetical protein [Sinosporangium siamense]|uniref:Uncharacterized protein n=1 Tax=Sinosporangium siamense TaxID=1367973 RepID=A0A919RBD8_9ACTN|nr:hypothetical protein [Sinosporangium siamense]GII90532.1 hypothetical protein Ssi02_07630 [Sinosporangium siamense]